MMDGKPPPVCACCTCPGRFAPISTHNKPKFPLSVPAAKGTRDHWRQTGLGATAGLLIYRQHLQPPWYRSYMDV